MKLHFIPLLTLLACGTSPSDSVHHTADTSSTASDLQPTITLSPEIGTVVFVTWQSGLPGTSWVEYGLTDALGSTTPLQSGLTSHELTLLGLRAGTTYHLRAHTELADGQVLQSDIVPFETGALPPGMNPPSLALDDGSTIGDGYVLYTQIQPQGGSYAVVVDAEGHVVWWRRGELGSIVTARPSEDGQAIRYAEYDLGFNQDISRLIEVSLDGRDRTETRLLEGHHDFLMRSNQTKVAFFAYTLDVPNNVATDAILEVPVGATDADVPTPVYSYLTDYVAPFWYVCEHVSAWAANPGFQEWTHSNSLMGDDNGLFYYAMSKFHDSVLKIEASTGNIVWQLNGLYGNFTSPTGEALWRDVGDTDLFSHGHMSHLWETPEDPVWDLCMAVFDNGYHYAPDASAIAQICVDEDTMTAERVWHYPEPSGDFTALMGDVRKLDDSYLVGWSSIGRVEEISDAGDVLWQLDLASGAIGGRVHYLDGLYPP